MGQGDDDDGLHDVVPVSIAHTVARRVREQLPTFNLEDLKGALVRVR